MKLGTLGLFGKKYNSVLSIADITLNANHSILMCFAQYGMQISALGLST